MNAVIGSIIENLKSIQIIFEPTEDIFKGDRTYTGDSKEYSVKEFVESYLTNDFRIKKGKIYSLDNESANIDCVILAPNHPNLLTPKREIILAEGVFCAIEVKPDIKSLSEKSEFNRSLKQIKTVKNLNRKHIFKINNNLNNSDYFTKIPGIIFSKKSSSAVDMIDFLRKKVKSKELGKEEIPDMIFSLENGVLLYTPHIKQTVYYEAFNELKKMYLDEEVFLHFHSDKEHINLLLFILLLLNYKTPEPRHSDFFIKNYLNDVGDEYNIAAYPLDENKKSLENPKFKEALLQNKLHDLLDKYDKG